MGSKSAVIVCEDARLDLAVTSSVISAFKTSGQRCVSAGRILVAESIFDDFAQAFVALVERLHIRDPLDAGNFPGPVIPKGSVGEVLGSNQPARKKSPQVLPNRGPLTQ